MAEIPKTSNGLYIPVRGTPAWDQYVNKNFENLDGLIETLAGASAGDLSALIAAVAGKADSTDVEAALKLKTNITDMNAALALKADKTALESLAKTVSDHISSSEGEANDVSAIYAAIAKKADKTDLDPLSGRIATNATEIAEIAEGLSNKADVSAMESIQGLYDKYSLTSHDIGEVAFFLLETPPDGWLALDGGVYPRTGVFAELYGKIKSFCGAGDGSTTFILPDWRGQFLRAKPSDRTIGSEQTDALQNITGSVHGDALTSPALTYTGAFYPNTNVSAYTSTTYAGSQSPGIGLDASLVARTATETRPVNVALLLCIKYLPTLANGSALTVEIPYERYQALGNVSGAITIDLAKGNIAVMRAAGALTISLTANASGYCRALTLIIQNGGAYAITWPTSVRWSETLPPTLTASGRDIISLITTDNGTAWLGMLSGGGIPV